MCLARAATSRQSNMPDLGKMRVIKAMPRTLVSWIFALTIALLFKMVLLTTAKAESEYTPTSEQQLSVYSVSSNPQIVGFSEAMLGLLFTINGWDTSKINDTPLTLFFIAEANAIQDGQISRDIFPDSASDEEIEFFTSQRSKSQHCSIGRLVLNTQAREVLFAVANLTEVSATDAQKCFLAALVVHAGGAADKSFDQLEFGRMVGLVINLFQEEHDG